MVGLFLWNTQDDDNQNDRKHSISYSHDFRFDLIWKYSIVSPHELCII